MSTVRTAWRIAINLRRHPTLSSVKSGLGRSDLVDHEPGMGTRSLILEKINNFIGLATPTGFEPVFVA